MTRAATPSLVDCLTREITALREFLAILTAEAAALERVDDSSIAALGDSTQRKQACAEALSAIQNQRNQYLQQAGAPESPDGLRLAAAAHPACLPLVDELLALTSAAAEQNNRNGIAIQIFQQHTQQALTELRALAGIEQLYDAQGRTRAAGSSAPLTNVRAG